MIECSRDGEVSRIRLASPSSRNELDSVLTQALLEALRAAEGRVILLESSGSVFASGNGAPGETLDSLLDCHRWLERPLVAAVQGPAAGAGVALMANAHLVIAAQGASFALTEIREGRWPESGWRALSAAIGSRQLRSLAMTGRVFSVQEALQWGLVHEICPPFELEDRAMQSAAHLANLRPEAIRSILHAEKESGPRA
jgi:enoyl-CoA hydratase/carnithine racemase